MLHVSRIISFACAVAAALAQPARVLAVDEPVTDLPEESSHGQQPVPAKGRLARIWSWSDAQLRDIVNVVLPETAERGTWEFEIEPRVGDFIRRDYVRVPVGVTYGFNRRTEGGIEVESYFANPREDTTGVGVSNLRANFKRKWKPSPGSQIQAASGFAFTRPIPSSPDELNQGVNRFSHYVTLSRRLDPKKSLEGILNLSFDIITPSSAGGRIVRSKPQDDFFSISPGILRHRGRITYGLAASWSHTTDGPAIDYYSITPSVIYEIPPKYVFNSPGRWQVGLAVEGRHYLDEYDVAVRVRVRWLGSLRRVYQDWRDQRRESMAARAAAH